MYGGGGGVRPLVHGIYNRMLFSFLFFLFLGGWGRGEGRSPGASCFSKTYSQLFS